jgi:DNA-directed RNA polymerase specialized sigma24 family protein
VVGAAPTVGVSGGRNGFDAAFDGLYTAAFAVSVAMVGDAVLAEELTVEALARVCAEWRRVVRRGQPERHAFRIVCELAIDAVARREPIGAFEASAAGLQHDEALALQALPRRRREVVALGFYADLRDHEIAELLGVTLATVLAEQREARRELGAMLGVPVPRR